MSSSYHYSTVDRPTRAHAIGSSKSPRGNMPELSDVPCYTCRRRHVKCDRILPHCAKCAKKGVPCAGYRKPLRWADGVAVRGKLKGKTEPVIDDQAISIARETIQDASDATREHAAQLGFNPNDSFSTNIQGADAKFVELITYYNDIICAPTYMSSSSLIQPGRITRISAQMAQQMPQEIVHCALSIAAVHLSIRNPGNGYYERLALETKVTMFRGINQLFQSPRSQRPDVLYTCILLMFAIDVVEHGVGRWRTHFEGAIKLLGSSGGIDNFALHYPRLRVSIADILRFETMHVLLLPVAWQEPKAYSKSWIRTICYDPVVRQRAFFSCPLHLMRATYDLSECAYNIHQTQGIPSSAEMYTREWVLSDVLLYQPLQGVQDLKETYYANQDLSLEQAQLWESIYTAWRAAITIIVLRQLFFGLSDSNLSIHSSRSPTPTGNSSPESIRRQQSDSTEFRLEFETSHRSHSFSERFGPHTSQDLLTPEHDFSDPLSNQPSPQPSPSHYSEDITFNFWHRRYSIHNDAVVELYNGLRPLLDPGNDIYLRYAMLPLVVLAFVSQRDSPERELCINGFTRFADSLIDGMPRGGPIGGKPLCVDIDWEQLDLLSAEEQHRQRSLPMSAASQLRRSAPEWNWSAMLERIQFKSLWPICAGIQHMETSTEFCSFNVMSAVCTEECFSAFLQPQS